MLEQISQSPERSSDVLPAVKLLQEVIYSEMSAAQLEEQKKISSRDLLTKTEKGTFVITDRGRSVASEWIQKILKQQNYDYYAAMQQVHALLMVTKQRTKQQLAHNTAATPSADIRYAELAKFEKYALVERICQSGMAQLRHQAAVAINRHTVGVRKHERQARQNQVTVPKRNSGKDTYFGFTQSEWNTATSQLNKVDDEQLSFEVLVTQRVGAIRRGEPLAPPQTDIEIRVHDAAIAICAQQLEDYARVSQQQAEVFATPLEERPADITQFIFAYDDLPDSEAVPERLDAVLADFSAKEQHRILQLVGAENLASEKGIVRKLSIVAKRIAETLRLPVPTKRQLLRGGSTIFAFASMLALVPTAKLVSPFLRGFFATDDARPALTIDMGLPMQPAWGAEAAGVETEVGISSELPSEMTVPMENATAVPTATAEAVPTATTEIPEQAALVSNSTEQQEVQQIEAADTVVEFLLSSVYTNFEQARFFRIDAMSESERAAFLERIGGHEQLQNGVLSVAVLGLDTGDEREAEYGNEGRADQIVVLSIDVHTGKVVLTNINRDIRVPELNGSPINTMTWYEEDENGNLVLRDQEVARTVLEQATGVVIDSVIEFNFDSAESVFDAMFPNGVSITLSQDEAFYSEYFGRDFPAGENILHGKDMLQFVRERKSTSTFARELNLSKLLIACVAQLGSDMLTLNLPEIPDNFRDFFERTITAIQTAEDPNGANDLRVLWDLKNSDQSALTLSEFMSRFSSGFVDQLNLESLGQLVSYFSEHGAYGGIQFSQVSLSTSPDGGLVGQDGKLAVVGMESESENPVASVQYWQLLRSRVAEALGRSASVLTVNTLPTDSQNSVVVLADGSRIELRTVPVTDMNRHLPIELPFQNFSGQRNYIELQRAIAALDITNNPRYQSTENATWCNIFAWDISRILGVEIPHWVDDKEMSANDLYDWFLNAESGGVNGAGWQEIDESTAQSYASRGIPIFAVAKNTSGGNGHIAIMLPDEAQRVNFASVGRRNGFGDKDFAFGELANSVKYFVNTQDVVESE